MTQSSLDLDLPTQGQSWVPTRAAAMQRLDGFVASAGSQYARQRNFDFGSGKHSKVSQLSPWIRHRLLMEEDVLSAVLKTHDLNAAEKFVQEVFWRGYFKGWLEHRPDVWQYYKQDVVQLLTQLETDTSLRRRYEEAVEGRTGLECFDHWANELIETGYLHNHARMWFASIWIHTLKLPWQLGADFFYRHLVDGDPASNTCSWRWVGGLHTVGKTYLARADNIEKFTGGRFFPKGALGASAPALEDPRPVQMVSPNVAMPDLMGRRVGLIITEEDCSAVSLPGSQPEAVLSLSGATERSLRPLGDVAKAFAPNAVRDATTRAKAGYEVPVGEFAGPDWSAAISEFVAEHDLEACVTARLTLGPVQKRLRKACKTAEVELIEITRAYDQAVWPHAKRGFFGLKKKIPSIFQALEL